MSIESNTNNATHLNIYKCSFHCWHIIIVKHVRHSINKRISRQNNEKALLVDLVCKAMHIPLNHRLYIFILIPNPFSISYLFVNCAHCYFRWRCCFWLFLRRWLFYTRTQRVSCLVTIVQHCYSTSCLNIH